MSGWCPGKIWGYTGEIDAAECAQEYLASCPGCFCLCFLAAAALCSRSALSPPRPVAALLRLFWVPRLSVSDDRGGNAVGFLTLPTPTAWGIGLDRFTTRSSGISEATMKTRQSDDSEMLEEVVTVSSFGKLPSASVLRSISYCNLKETVQEEG